MIVTSKMTSMKSELSELRRRKIAEGLESAREALSRANGYMAAVMNEARDSASLRLRPVLEAIRIYGDGLKQLETVKSVAASERVEAPDMTDLMRYMQEGYIGASFAHFGHVMANEVGNSSYEHGLKLLRSVQRDANKWGVPISEERVAALQRTGVEKLLTSSGKKIRAGRNLPLAIKHLNEAERYGPDLGVDVSAVDGLRIQAYESGMHKYVSAAIAALDKARRYSYMAGSPAAAVAADAKSRLEELVRK